MMPTCILCGKEVERGGFSTRIAGVILRPLCPDCDHLCTNKPNDVVKDYPWLFDPSKPRPVLNSELTQSVGADTTAPQPTKTSIAMYCHKCGKELQENMAFCPACGTQKTQSTPLTDTNVQQGSKLDFKVLAKFVIVLGIVVFAYGGFNYITNLPVSISPGGTGLEAIGRAMEASDQNMIRSYERDKAGNIMIGGAIVAFIGIAVAVSSKKGLS